MLLKSYCPSDNQRTAFTDRIKRLTITGLTALLAATSVPALAHDRSHNASHSADEPGEPAKPSRTVEIEMSEMTYEPIKIGVKLGEQIHFVLRNVGTEDHEFLRATTKENLKHASVVKKRPHMQHEEPNGVRVAPKKAAEIVWKFTKSGTFEYSCLIPHHREYGMTGHVLVK